MIVALIALLWADAHLQHKGIGVTGLIGTGLGCVIILLAAMEMAALIRARGIAIRTTIAAAGSIALGLTAHCTAAHTAIPVVVAVALAAMGWHVRGRTLDGVMASAGATLLVTIVLGGLGGFWLAIRLDFTVTALVVVLLLTKCGDIGAYFGGRLLGRHKMIPWLSPAKTWEGLVVGVLFAALAGSGVLMLLNEWSLQMRSTVEPGHAWTSRSILYFGLLAAALALVGAAGDLMFSLFKRDAGVKDSSSVIPGFGGVLDVIDSPLLAAPVGYWLLRLGESMQLI